MTDRRNGQQAGKFTREQGLNKRNTGKRYESLAADYLQGQGLTIMERNYQDRTGEIDLIGRDGTFLVFVEVKYRKDAGNGYPEEAVSVPKQKRIRHTASWYLYQQGRSDETPCRNDVLSIQGQQITQNRDAS